MAEKYIFRDQWGNLGEVILLMVDRRRSAAVRRSTQKTPI
jgi:hypothetical protein